MLLKASDGADGWVLFDNCEQVHLVGGRYILRTREEIDAFTFEGEQPINLVSKECLRAGAPIAVGVIEFYRHKQRQTVLFTSVAFICNDAGDTLERVNPSAFNRERKSR